MSADLGTNRAANSMSSMKIGILSDTHGDAPRTRRAMALLMQHEVSAICHCGDIGSESVLVEMAAACAPRQIVVYAVLGNVDHYAPEVTGFPTGAGVVLCGRCASLELAGRTVAVVHGDDASLLFQVVRAQQHDYCLIGQTDRVDDFKEGRIRVINPGAVYRAPLPSVAVLDLESDELRVIPLTA